MSAGKLCKWNAISAPPVSTPAATVTPSSLQGLPLPQEGLAGPRNQISVQKLSNVLITVCRVQWIRITRDNFSEILQHFVLCIREIFALLLTLSTYRMSQNNITTLSLLYLPFFCVCRSYFVTIEHLNFSATTTISYFRFAFSYMQYET